MHKSKSRDLLVLAIRRHLGPKDRGSANAQGLKGSRAQINEL
ncbi:unnamed protein product [Acidithrix sp. C25]|nr:unnamed protein product [Acidithrix sp. C25]